MQLRAFPEAARAGAEVIQAGASRRAPRETGQLAGDILIVLDLNPAGIVARIGPSLDSFYGLFQEFGTNRHPAHPFMRPTLDEDGPAARAAIGRSLTRATGMIARRFGA